MQLKYSRLKKKYKSLRDEYSKVLESWELGAKSIKSLLDERKFLKKKLDTFFKSQNFIDEQIFKSNLDESKTQLGQKKTQMDLTGTPNMAMVNKPPVQNNGIMRQEPPKQESNDIQIISQNNKPSPMNNNNPIMNKPQNSYTPSYQGMQQNQGMQNNQPNQI